NTYTQDTPPPYPVHYIQNILTPSNPPHPNTIIFLTPDPFPLIPPISNLTKHQPIYHFLTPFTSKLPPTEPALTQPQPSFSTSFPPPFLPLTPTNYPHLLPNLIHIHHLHLYLLNTPSTPPKYAIPPTITLHYTPQILHQPISPKLKNTKYIKHHT
ncbi:phosphoenolpyruvate carboxykinase (ATP), partial [Staphylococcus epidermidis]|uniref:phosphoenolpyruvate carboxykinase (ATP) n=1 Tax=Staphylococcus epidermidis TaxID=1282 RepID=UPI00119D7EAE